MTFFINDVLLQRCKTGMSREDFTKFAAAYLTTMVDGTDEDDASISDKSDSWVVPSVTSSNSPSGLKRTLEALKVSSKREAKKDHKMRKTAGKLTHNPCSRCSVFLLFVYTQRLTRSFWNLPPWTS